MDELGILMELDEEERARRKSKPPNQWLSVILAIIAFFLVWHLLVHCWL